MTEHLEFDNDCKDMELERFLGSIKEKKASPTIIAIGGMHGNELAGIYALKRVFKRIEKEKIPFSGNFYGLSGNLKAIANNVRFNKVDLNRLWTKESVEKIISSTYDEFEAYELKELYYCIKKIVKKNSGPFIFLDLHTTSADTQPFITISDSLNNRKFSSKFSIPTVLGIEEFLEGPLLSYINEFGHVSLGFEAGQHNKKSSIDNCESFLYLALEALKCLKKEDIKDFDKHKKRFSNFKNQRDFYEIKYKYEIQKGEDFKMLKGFKNFEEIFTNQVLANSNGKSIKSSFSGQIFMPLYQEKGDDGFFIISKISKKWLIISKYLRKLKLHKFLKFLPGIKSLDKEAYTLIVNPNIAKFFTTDFFHLFGYRKKIRNKDKWLFMKRDKKVSEFM